VAAVKSEIWAGLVISSLIACGVFLTAAASLSPGEPPGELEAVLQQVRSSWVRLGPPGGHVPQIVFSPTNPRVVYAGLDDDQGLYKSTDGGESWILLSKNLRDMSAGTLAIHPKNDRIILLGDSFYGGGLYKSTDGGQTWDYKGFKGRYFNFRSIEVSRTRPDTVYLGLGKPWFLPHLDIKGDLYKSEDFGESWKKITPPEPSGRAEQEKVADKNAWYIQVDALDASIVYVAIYGGIYVTRDGGGSWKRSLELPRGARGVIAIAADPNLPNVAYAGIGKVLLRTTDGGKSWGRIDQEIPDDFTVFSNWPGLFVSPHDPRTLYVGMPPLMSWPLGPIAAQPQGIFRSQDGGRTWKRIDEGYDGNSLLSIAISPHDPKVLFLGTEGRGILRSDDGGVTWSYKNKGLLSAWVTSLALDPLYPNIIYTGVADGHPMDNSECFKSTDGGQSWEYKKGKRYDVWTQWAVDPENTAIVYGAGGGVGLAEKSTDGGETWETLMASKDLPYRVSLELNTQDPRVLYAAGKQEVWKSSDKGATWKRVKEGLDFPILQWDVIALVPGGKTDPPGNNDHLYVGARSGIIRSYDGGETWSSSGLTGVVFTALTAYRSAESGQDVVYAGTGFAGFYVSVDSGETWAELPTGFRQTVTTDILVHPKDQNIVLVCNAGEAHLDTEGSTPGLYLSTDRGQTWVELTPTNLPYATLYNVAVHPQQPHIIYVASPGGVLKLALPDHFYEKIQNATERSLTPPVPDAHLPR